jgi:hypothetical protein
MFYVRVCLSDARPDCGPAAALRNLQLQPWQLYLLQHHQLLLLFCYEASACECVIVLWPFAAKLLRAWADRKRLFGGPLNKALVVE